MSESPVRARAHTDDDEPIIWQLTPQSLQKTWDAIFAAAADLASKERKKDLKALQAALGDMQHAIKQVRARVQSLDDRMIRLGNDVAAQRAAFEQWTHAGEVRDGVSTVPESPRRTPMALFETFLRDLPARTHQCWLRKLGLRPGQARDRRYLGTRPGSFAGNAGAVARTQADRHRWTRHFSETAAHRPGQSHLPAVRADRPGRWMSLEDLVVDRVHCLTHRPTLLYVSHF